MTKKKEAGATSRQYDAALKAEAVRLWQSSRDSAEKTAHELGISVFNLYKWKREGAAPRAAGGVAPSRSEGAIAGRGRTLAPRADADDRAT